MGAAGYFAERRMQNDGMMEWWNDRTVIHSIMP